MRFGVLGPLAVWTSRGEPVAIPEAKVRVLLADLLAHEGRPVPTGRLIDDLWGARLPANPAGALQTKVSRLRQALQGAEPGGRDLVASGPSGYFVRLGPGALDAAEFAVLTGRARRIGDPAARAALLAEALRLWRGPALADFAGEDFARGVAARWDEDRLLALEDHAEARLVIDTGSIGPVVGELAGLVAAHPLRERLRAAHMRALYLAGRQTEALAAYGELRDLLAAELGLAPGPELAELHTAILRQDPSLLPAASPRTNLPAPLSDLIGRADAIREITRLLGAGRLVTLTGLGGVGKSRLAVAAADRLTGGFPDGVWLVELAALCRSGGGTGPAERCGPDETDATPALAERIMTVLGVRETGASAVPLAAGDPAGPLERLAAALGGRRLLLVLDNCEHLVEPVAEVVAALLRAAPGVRVLTTSQEPIGVPGELLWTVPPLDCPPPGADPAADPAALSGYGAVRLFTRRAAAAAPGFALDDGNAAAVAAICRRLDGIPLALELAATRVRTLGVHELLTRLDDRFRVLTTGPRAAPERHRTLRATIDWSWSLLPDAERAVLRRLAMHAGACTLRAAEETCAGGEVGRTDVLDLLARLVERSLVVMTEADGEPRYSLLESVAEYGMAKLAESGEYEWAREAHGRYYTALAEEAEPHLRGPDQRHWLSLLAREHADLRRALHEAVRDRLPDRALRLAGSLTWYWFLRGRLAEARRSLSAALAISEPGRPGRALVLAWRTGIALHEGDEHYLRAAGIGRAGRREGIEAILRPFRDSGDPYGLAMAEWFIGFPLHGSGDWDLAEELLRRSLAGFRALDARWGVAAALGSLAMIALARGDLAGLRRQAEHSAAIFEELGDRWGRSQAIWCLSTLAEITGDYARAERSQREGLRMAEELGLWNEVADRLAGLGRLAMLAGDHDRARDLTEHALRVATEQGSVPGRTFAELGLGLIARRAGDLDTAEHHFRRLLGWYRRAGYDAAIPLLLSELGFIAELRHDPAEAARLHRTALSYAESHGDPRALALALEGLAGARSAGAAEPPVGMEGAGGHVAAARLLGAAAALRESFGAPLPPAERGDVDRITATATAALGADTFATAYAHGAATQRTGTLDALLGDPPPDTTLPLTTAGRPAAG
ncbi:AfsR/SARP family transcriptional regulator [Spongiactinospora rosea]|uniref:AfsR/SARP family transcriptional regulator n=1 Tax=Spongiactinospora rosea TaxID=2248750 RepID=A0A366LSH3_9ACTN|nr:BTAD domain-containing putative transcriptional regulator [Spongiactinospora rosea]RBQ16868.1 AfsR/SARP family transcriptional regulator [Spongiactinospora rosea]